MSKEEDDEILVEEIQRLKAQLQRRDNLMMRRAAWIALRVLPPLVLAAVFSASFHIGGADFGVGVIFAFWLMLFVGGASWTMLLVMASDDIHSLRFPE